MLGRKVGLVAGHREAHDVGVRMLGGMARDSQRLLDAEVAHRGDQDASLDPELGPGVVDTRRDPVPVLLVAQADERGMVWRGGELDVDGAAARAVAQVLIGDVAIVLRGANHAGGQVIGAQEVQEIAVAKAPVVAQQPLGQGDRRCAAARRAISSGGAVPSRWTCNSALGTPCIGGGLPGRWAARLCPNRPSRRLTDAPRPICLHAGHWTRAKHGVWARLER